MKEFLEKSLRQQVTIMEDKELYKKFPLVYRGRYDIFKVETNGVVWMAIYPKDNVGLIMLRRDRAKVEKITGLNCAIFLLYKREIVGRRNSFCAERKTSLSSIYWIFAE